MVVPRQLSLYVRLSQLLCGKNLLSNTCVPGQAICDTTLQSNCWTPAANLLAKCLAGMYHVSLTYLQNMSIHMS